MLQKLRPYMMPLALILGILLHEHVRNLSFLMPYAISLMLFFTYSSIDYKKLNFNKLHFVLIVVQLFGSFMVYWLLKPFSEIVAQGAMVLMVIPVASASAVITNMLGGSLESITAYNILNNMVMAIASPFFFTMANSSKNIGIFNSVIDIAKHVGPLLFLPLFCAYLLYKFAPKVQREVKKYKNISFYIWVLTLVIAIGKTFTTLQTDDSRIYEEIGLVSVALLICIFQFGIGRYIGQKYNEEIVGGQALGQKNTILGIWMAHSFLNYPIASLAPGAYIVWQNLMNFYHLWKRERDITKNY